MVNKIVIITSGGDAPGMNTAIYSLTKRAMQQGIEVFWGYDGYKGLVEGNIKPANLDKARDNQRSGGTIIYSARLESFKQKEVRAKAIKNLKDLNIDSLIVIGGDGSYNGALRLSEEGINTIALPGTIDNDINNTDWTIGFFTAIETIADSVAQIRDTMESHNRAVIIEAMGRNKGDLSFFASKLVECDIVSTPEDPMTEEEVLNSIVKLRSEGKRSIVALVTENMYDIQALAEKITNTTEVETRGVILGHAQRGGKANNIDYEIATDMSYKAIETLEEGKSGVSIGLVNNELIVTPIKEALDTKSTKTQSELLNDFNNREWEKNEK